MNAQIRKWGFKVKKGVRIPGLALMFICAAGHFLAWPAWAETPVMITVSILPQKHFVERIGGDRVSVSVMVLPGANPATYEPKPRQMADLTRSRIYFAIGVPFETVWLDRFAHASPKMEIVSTQEGIEKIVMEARHTHENEDAHRRYKAHAEARDPHIWLAPPLVMIQARHVMRTLIAVDPAGRAVYEANYRQFITELVDLDIKIGRLFSNVKRNNRFMVYHPAWGYFAQAYGLVQIPLETEGKSLTPRALQRLIDQARQEGIRAIFVQPQFSTKSAEVIARAINGSVIPADPLALDWANNLLKVAGQLRTELR